MARARIGRMRVEGCRNIRATEVDLGGDPAFFFGPNGSGKTSVLEAVYVLARGRSFRGRRSGEVKGVGLGRMLIGAEMVDEARETVCRLSYERGECGARRRLDGRAVEDWGEWMDRLPVRLVGESASELLVGEPTVRRAFLDLNLFHVEQNGASVLRRFRRALAQRNAWLRNGGGGRAVWDDEFVASAVDLHQSRSRLLDGARLAFQELSGCFDFGLGAKLTYRKGWGDGVDLGVALKEDLSGGRDHGFTRVGPQRADFSFDAVSKGVGWSRGQAKVLVCLLQLALDRVQLQRRGSGAVWLLDDVWADLDVETASVLLDLLLSTGSQCLFTAAGDALTGWGRFRSEIRMFHVKQGEVTAVD